MGIYYMIYILDLFEDMKRDHTGQLTSIITWDKDVARGTFHGMG